jgi:methyl-accepting chemotaxis protein
MALFARLLGGNNAVSAQAVPAPSEVPAEPPLASSASGDLAARVRESLDLLEADLRVLIGQVGAAADRVHDRIGTSTQSLDAIGVSTGDLSRLADLASQNVTVLASATEQIAQSSSEISRQVLAATRLTDEAGESANRAGNYVDRLRDSTSRIDSIVNLIASIAKQTNLLALNARIEAARAGDAGKGFAVVAAEVKALASETQRATAEIAQQVDALRRDAEGSIDTLGMIAVVLDQIRPLFAAIAGSVEEQVSTTNAVSHNATDTSKFAVQVSDRAKSIKEAVSRLTEESAEIDRSAGAASDMTRTLSTRLSIFLRQTEIGDRRRFDRLPCERAATVSIGSIELRGRIVDLGEGGVLVEPEQPPPADANGALVALDLVGIGRSQGRLANCSHLGMHMQFVDVTPDFQRMLGKMLADIRAENREIVELTKEAGIFIATMFEEAIRRGQLQLDQLFDNRYEPIPDTNPQQYRTPYLSLLEEILTPIQEKLLASDPRMIFCAAVDRNAYLPVHNLKYSHPQRPDDVTWNIANCRNRRIFDDRAGLCAARSARPFLIQSYPRDMGTGAMVWMKEIDVPIRVHGRHWGGFRMAYRL